MADRRIQYTLGFDADTSKAKAQMRDLQNELNKLTSMKTNGLSIDKDIFNAKTSAKELQIALRDATNVDTGRLDLTKFAKTLKNSGKNIKDYAVDFEKLGTQGQQAFRSIASAIVQSEIPLKRTNKLLDEMAVSLSNTIKWQLSSSAVHGFMGAIQGAYGYAQDLNKSLNDIRIVTGRSTDEMAEFAKQANNSAKALSTSTIKYTEAALIYYQQGLTDDQVKARTDTTIKMANVTGENAAEVSSYMTAIWNNFDNGSKSLEYYSDVITALGAATAASSEEIAGGLEKFAAVGETVGLSYEYATAALTTIIDKTRQSEDVVGTALKTIFARVQGLQQGETAEDGVTLNKYSKALENVGIQIMDTSGELKAMDDILNELGQRWQTLSKAEQVALAQTVGGTRQYTQLIALMDNWGAMQENLSTAYNSSGSLEEQAKIYAESWEAAQKRVTASLETIYQQLLNDKFFISLSNAFADGIDLVSKFIDTIGGLPGVLAVVGIALGKTFKDKLPNLFSGAMENIQNFTGVTARNAKAVRQDALSAQEEQYMGDVTNTAIATQLDVDKVYSSRLKLLEKEGAYSDDELKKLRLRIELEKELGETQVSIHQEVIQLEKELQLLEEEFIEAAIKEEEEKNGRKLNKNERKKIRKNAKDNFSKIKDNDTVQSLNDIEQIPKGFEEKTQKIIDGRNKLNKTNEELEKSEEKIKEIREQNTAIMKGESDQFDVNQQQMELYTYKMSQMETGFVEAGKSIASFTIAWSSLSNAFKVLNDDSLSGLEKFERVLPSLLAGLPALYTGFVSLTKAYGAFQQKGFEGLMLKAAEAVLDEKQIKNLGEKVTWTTIYTALKNKETGAEAANNVTKGAGVIVTKALDFASKSLLATLGTLAVAIVAVVAVGAGLIALWNWIKDNSPEGKLKKANEELENSKKAAQEASTAYNNLKSSIDSLESAQNTLAGLTKGTLEWKEAVLKVNEQVLDLIDKYPELAQYMTTSADGVLGISEEGMNKVLDQKINEANSLQRAALSDQRNVTELKNKQQNNKFTLSYLEGDSGTRTQYVDPVTHEVSYQGGPVTRTISNEQARSIANNLQYDESGKFNLDATLKAAGITNASEEFKKAILDNLPALEGFKNNLDEADLELQKLDESIAKTWLSTHTTDNDPEMNGFIATGMSKRVDSIKDDIEKDYNLTDSQAKRAYAEANLGPDATESEIQEYIKKIDEKIKNDELTMDTIKESIISSAANYKAYQETQALIAQTDKYKGQAGYDTVKNIMAAGGDASAFNALTKEEYDAFKKMAFDENGKLRDEFKEMFSIFGDDFIATLENTFSNENRAQYEEDSQKNQDALYKQKINQTAAGLGVDADALEAYAQHLQETNKNLKDNREAALAAAEANIRWNKGINNLSDVLDDNADALKKSNKGTWDYYQALGKVQDAASDLLGIDVSVKYAEEHLEDLKKAVNGDEEAIKRLQQTAAVDWAETFVQGVQDVKDAEGNLTFDASDWTSKFMDAIDDVASTLGSLDTDVHLGADSSELDAAAEKSINDMIELANTAMAAGQMTEAEMRQMFGSMGYTPEVTYEEVDQESTVKGHVKVGPLTIPYENTSVNTVKVPKIADANGDGKTSLTKITTAGSLGGSTKKPSGSGGGSKKEGKEIERYHTVNKELESMRKQLDAVAKAKDRAFSEEDRLKAMEKEIALYDQIIAKEKEKLALIEKDLTKDKASLEKFGAQIDPNTGAVLNYEELMKKWNNQLESGKMSQEKYDERIKALEQWEETWALWEDQAEKVADETAAKISAELANIEFKAEVKLKFNEQELKYLDHLLSKLEDKSFSGAEKMGLLGDKLSTELKKYDVNVEKLYDLMEQSGLTLEEAMAVMTGTASKEILDKLNDEQEDAFLKLGEDFMSGAEEIAALQEEMTQTLIDSITEAVDKYAELGEEITHVTDTLQHYQNLIDILGEEKLGIGAADVAKLMQNTVDSSIANLNNSQQTLDWLKSEKERLTKELENASEDKKAAIQKALDETDDQIRAAESQVQSDLESVLNMIVEQFELHVKQATDAFEKAMSGTFGSLEKLQEAFDREKQIDDLYVDDYKKVYELTKLTRDISKSIDETDNLKAKKELRDLQQEINDLQKSGIQLSEYDIDMLNKKYELRLAEIALEDAQNAKSQVRMTRDSEGNWSYTYTADESSIADAEQAYEDKLYAMQEANQEYIKNLQSQYLSTQAEMIQAIQALGTDATEEQTKAIQQHYQTIMDAQISQMQNALGDSNYALGFMTQETEGWVNSFDETTLSMLTGFETLESYQLAFVQSTNEMVNGVGKALDVYNENIKKAGINVEDFSKKLAEVQENAKKELEEIEKDSKELADNATKNTTDALAKLQKAYEDYGLKADAATSSTWGLVDAIKALAQAKAEEAAQKPKDPEPQKPTETGNTSSWEKVKSGYNAINTGQWGNGNVRKKAALAAGFTEQEYQLAQKLINLVYGGMSMNDAKKALGFASGGYTGAWGASGKLAFLHEKELVLNADDTQNMLKSIEMVRAIAQTIDLNSGSTLGWGGLSSIGVGNGKSEIVQDITINAEFPNATDQNEIKAAFDSLFIRASQYANRK